MVELTGERQHLVGRDVDAERLRDRLAALDGPPRAPGLGAEQVQAKQQRGQRTRQEDVVPGPGSGERNAAEARGLDLATRVTLDLPPSPCDPETVATFDTAR
jgi:hypothetical protein